jgi:hypothetical protein
LGQFPGVLRDCGSRWSTFARNLHGWEREFDPVVIERRFDHRMGLGAE